MVSLFHVEYLKEFLERCLNSAQLLINVQLQLRELNYIQIAEPRRPTGLFSLGDIKDFQMMDVQEKSSKYLSW